MVSILVKWHLQPPAPPPYFVKYHDYDEMLFQNILSLTLTLGCNNKKWPSGPIEIDLEAGNFFCWNCSEKLLKITWKSWKLNVTPSVHNLN